MKMYPWVNLYLYGCLYPCIHGSMCFQYPKVAGIHVSLDFYIPGVMYPYIPVSQYSSPGSSIHETRSGLIQVVRNTDTTFCKVWEPTVSLVDLLLLGLVLILPILIGEKK